METGSGTDPRIGTVTLLADALGVGQRERQSLLAAADGRYQESSPESPGPGPGSSGGGAVSVPVGGAVGPVTGAASALPVLPVVPAEVSEAADHLALVVAARLRREEELRRLHDPFPLPVRWRPAPARLADHWDNICRVPVGVSAGPLELSGEVGDIAGTYLRVPSGRLVVLGQAGSGKTVLTLRFVLDMLAARTPGGAVPMIFNVGSWDPTAAPLRGWLVELLQRDQPGLAAEAPGGATLAAVLVDTGRILPVLDGFDEIAQGLHRPALETLNSLSMPLLLTSRVEEYQRAVTVVDVLTSAAVVELTDLTPDDLGGYLPRTARQVAVATEGGGTATAWDSVITALRDHDTTQPRPATAHLATVLRTPLMVSLARTVYSDSRDHDPTELLDDTRFPTPQHIEEHLLDSFVPTVYHQHPTPTHHGKRHDWDIARLRRWLGFLADDLDRQGTSDLEWWRISGRLRDSTRVLLVTGFACVASLLVDWLVFTPVHTLTSGMTFHWYVALLDGLVIGPVIGLPVGLLYLLMVVRKGKVLEPTRVRVRLLDGSGRQPGLRRKVATRFLAGALGGGIGGVGYGIARTIVMAVSPNLTLADEPAAILRGMLVDAAICSVVFGLACGLVLALAAALEAPANLTTATSPADLLAANRTTVLRLAGALSLALALALAFGGVAVTSALRAALGPVPWSLNWNVGNGLLVGLIGGLSTGLAYIVAFTAWGQWLLFTRFRLPASGRLPWAVGTFLDDAYRRGVLRQSGAVYQFRHARLQEHLAKAYRTGR
ncbi:hypothetical protein FHU38_000757 [Saccharomonospora amisosensis]|uniref:NACHT domain-containing protein n=1 Tax=Saccharomonospora amisosensis TaxID=1128677 RepID=A0A7X5ULV5_9PSEU|nr:hypothetical protein [Saccharomonospora amisosensis]